MKTIEVVASIIHQNGKILATQRGYGEYKGLWEFPGGKMEPGETEEQAIASRKGIMEMAKKEGLTMYGMHFPTEEGI